LFTLIILDIYPWEKEWWNGGDAHCGPPGLEGNSEIVVEEKNPILKSGNIPAL
jgi:hypothetical protein